MPWPSVGARIRRAWPWAESASSGADGGALRQTPIEDQPLAPAHSNLLWVAVPDVVGDADATLEQFRAWHMWLCHLPLAFVLQDGAERPGRVPWQAPGLAAVFLGGSTRWKLGPEAAGLVCEARRARPARACGQGLDRKADPLRAVDRLHVVRQLSLLPLARATARRRARSRQSAAAAAAHRLNHTPSKEPRCISPPRVSG